jgi:ASC-1-like (ASCH) protein
MSIQCFEKHLSEPWFSWIKNGIKTVIGRPNCGEIKNILPGDTIIWFNDDCGPGSRRYIKTRVIYFKEYKNFKEMLDKEKLGDIASVNFVKTKKKALEIINKCYTKRIINNYGVLSIKVKVVG